MKAIGVFLRIGWTAVCIAALVDALQGYRGAADWTMEENLGFEMLVLGFPGAYLIAVCLALVGYILGIFRMALPQPSRIEMVGTWIFFVAAGYAQWFALLPRLFLRLRRRTMD
jgi:hypothetical protein